MSNTENSLMKQTKKELVSIILRKDDTEKKLNKKISDIEYTIKDLKEDLDVSNGIISQRNNDVDKLTVVNTRIEHSLRYAKRWNIALAILFVCAVVVAIVF